MIYTDGFSNNKESGYTVCDRDGNVLNRTVFPSQRTSNEAELRGVYAALQFASDLIVTDSKVVTYWVRSGQCQARPDLTPVARAIYEQLLWRGIKLEWRPREQNKAGKLNEKYLK